MTDEVLSKWEADARVKLGQHSVDILREICKVQDERILALIDLVRKIKKLEIAEVQSLIESFQSQQ